MDVIRYDEVIHEAKDMALNSFPIVEKVEAATVPSKPDKNTLIRREVSIQMKFGTSEK